MMPEQLIDTVKTCLDMIERLESDLAAESRKRNELSALVRKMTEERER